MYQKNIYVGRVGRDPEMRFTPSGQAVTAFSIGVNEEYTNAQGEKVKKTLWVRVETWGKTAEACNQYVKKGMIVLVEGKLKHEADGNPRLYQKQDKTWASSFELTAQVVRFLSKSEASSMVETAQEVGGVPVEDDVPF
jgi:single-strand DNA-binding protein